MNAKARSDKDQPSNVLTEEQRRHYVEVAAYYIAEKRRFECGCEMENWLATEAEIDRLLTDGKSRQTAQQ